VLSVPLFIAGIMKMPQDPLCELLLKSEKPGKSEAINKYKK
jgi:hypothetical protein